MMAGSHLLGKEYGSNKTENFGNISRGKKETCLLCLHFTQRSSLSAICTLSPGQISDNEFPASQSRIISLGRSGEL
jgi:hypothetical protein